MAAFQANRNAVLLPRPSVGEGGRRPGEGAPRSGEGLRSLQATARERRNVFASLMEAVKTHSLGQISHALYDVGGEYRRNM